jgi:multiple sugar transport system substrate-binding protein
MISMSALSRRSFVTALWGGSAVLGAGMLAACGATTAPSASSGPVSTTAPTTNSAPAAIKPTGTIEFWQGWSTRTMQLRTYLDQFEKENPGTKVLDAEFSDMGGRPKVVTNVVAGTMPDCLMVFKDMYALVVPAKVVVGLNKYISRDKVDMKQFAESDVKERTFSGDLVAMPSASGGSGSGTLVYWNKAHFKEVGLNPDQGPKDWAELDQYIAKLNRPGERLALNPAGRFLSWLYTTGGKLYSDTEGRKLGIDSVESRDTLRYLMSISQKQGGAEVIESLGANGRSMFFQGKHTMLLEADLLPSLAAVDPLGKQLEWGIGLLPFNQAKSGAKYQTPSRGGHGYSVTSAAKNPEGAWALAKFLTTSDAQCDFMVNVQGRISTLSRCNTAPEMQKRPEFQVYSKMLAGVVSQPFSPGDDKAVAALEKHATNAALGKASIDASITAAVQEAQFELDEGWKLWKA